MSDQTIQEATEAELNAPHPTDEAGINAAVQAALAAIESAGDLTELKDARLAHPGEKSALSLANRQIGKLDKSEKAVAGKLVGGARGRVNKALAARTVVLEEAEAARILDGERSNTARMVSLNCRTLANPDAKAASAIGMSVVSTRMRAVCARSVRARASGPAPTSAESNRFSWRSL